MTDLTGKAFDNWLANEHTDTHVLGTPSQPWEFTLNDMDAAFEAGWEAAKAKYKVDEHSEHDCSCTEYEKPVSPRRDLGTTSVLN